MSGNGEFIHDATIKGGTYRMLSVIDEYTREVHALHVARNIGSGKLLEVIRELIGTHGAPGYIRSDNGPEFIAKSLQEWLAENSIKTLYIDPGCPQQNGYVESFHAKFRRECLSRELFYTLSEAMVVIAAWRRKFKQIRSHRSLNMKTPEKFAFGLVLRGGSATQSASYAAASGLLSGSRLTTPWEPRTMQLNPLTLVDHKLERCHHLIIHAMNKLLQSIRLLTFGSIALCGLSNGQMPQDYWKQSHEVIPISGANGLCVSSDGKIFSSHGTSIKVSDFTGALQDTYTGFGSVNGMVFNSAGELFVYDLLATNRIRKVDSNGSVVAEFGTVGAAAGQFTSGGSGYI